MISGIPLFSPPDAFALRGMEILDAALDAVFPLSQSQRRDLPRDCRQLSALLTTKRRLLERPYWASASLTSAYLRYFLPWNLMRLASLLPALPLPSPPASPLILDLGSGPLTLPLALWLSRADLRSLPVTVIASDNAPHPLLLGRRIFDHVRARLDPASPWILRGLRAPLHEAPRRAGRPWLITLGNVLNELERRSPASMPQHFHSLLAAFAGPLASDGLILALEPGTRQGGRLLSLLRQKATENDPPSFSFRPLSPCPHAAPCPLFLPHASAWCHFNAPAGNAPAPLRELSRQAGLSKDSLSLSFLLLQKSDAPPPPPPSPLPARLVSDPFPLPGRPGRARYACTSKGLALIPDSASLPSGALCSVRLSPARDAKSRAFLAALVN
jgi:ribosomal protein RSM22 (predicted rRNA methylase)